MLLHGLVFILGLLLVIFTITSAIRTFVLPRGDNVALTRWIFNTSHFFFNLRNMRSRTYEERDRNMALFAPVTLLVIPIIWVVLVIVGYACMYWGMGIGSWADVLTVSGSSLLTLGTTPFPNFPATLLMFSEATFGLGLVALLIAYLPTMYSAFSRREAQVIMLEVRAGSPPSAVEMILRLHRIRGLDRQYLNEVWASWEVWFTELEESHTSLAPLVFFRSSRPDQSWITAAGTILDAAALLESTVEIERNPQAHLTLRAGYLALRSIARFFDIPFDPDPAPDDPISISRQEYDEVCEELSAAGVPLRADREQTWRDYAGWRVNYDTTLLRLAALTMAPYARWSSDRSLPAGIETWKKLKKTHKS